MRKLHFAGRLAGLTAALCMGSALVAPGQAQAQITISISADVAPPPLPIYEQPPIPGPNYLWTPGYWAWDSDVYDYYWVPGTWVQAPTPGYLWTPGYWGWQDGSYAFHQGYWGPHIGFYGGIDYGFGYTGAGYEGGYWNGGNFFYNRSVNNVGDAHIANVYAKPVTVARSQVSFNGGSGGVEARPTAEQTAAARERHVPPTAMQLSQRRAAAGSPTSFASKNHGMPPVAATARPGVLSGPGVVKPTAGSAKPYVLTAGHGPKPEAATAAARPAAGAKPEDDRRAAATASADRTAHAAPVRREADAIPNKTPEHEPALATERRATPEATRSSAAAEPRRDVAKPREAAPEREAAPRVVARAEPKPPVARAAPKQHPAAAPKAARPAPERKDDHAHE